MKHPSDDILLAYVRQQQHQFWPQGIQEHIATCSICRTRCAEFRNIGDTMEAWLRASATDLTYTMVSQRVMRKLYSSEASSQQSLPGFSRMRPRISIIVMLVLLCLIVLTGVAVNTAAQVARLGRPQSTAIIRAHYADPTTHESSVTLTPGQTVMPTNQTPIPTNPVVVTTPTPPSKQRPAINTSCTTKADVIQNHLQLCGSNFTPGSTVTILYMLTGNRQRQHTSQVSGDGTFTDTLVVNDCKNVPIVIYAQSTANPPDTAQIQKNIVFGNCQAGGKMGNVSLAKDWIFQSGNLSSVQYHRQLYP